MNIGLCGEEFCQLDTSCLRCQLVVGRDTRELLGMRDAAERRRIEDAEREGLVSAEDSAAHREFVDASCALRTVGNEQNAASAVARFERAMNRWFEESRRGSPASRCWPFVYGLA